MVEDAFIKVLPRKQNNTSLISVTTALSDRRRLTFSLPSRIQTKDAPRKAIKILHQRDRRTLSRPISIQKLTKKTLRDMVDYEEYLKKTAFADAKEFEETAHEQKSKTVQKK